MNFPEIEGDGRARGKRESNEVPNDVLGFKSYMMVTWKRLYLQRQSLEKKSSRMGLPTRFKAVCQRQRSENSRAFPQLRRHNFRKTFDIAGENPADFGPYHLI
jgi:hypothetical protein